MDCEKKFKHMDYIQNTISRMASNSFLLKGWAVTLVSGIFVLASKDTEKMYFLLAYVPAVLFWLLDSYYLLQERLYRALYNKVKDSAEDDIDFDMNANKDEFRKGKNKYCCCLVSISELPFYVGLILVIAVVVFLTT